MAISSRDKQQSAPREFDNFVLGDPALVCRWRLASQTLPLQNRHLRALAAREIQGKPVSKNLVAWVKQNIEWTLETGSKNHPDGVLMLIVDKSGKAAMTVGPYEELAHCFVATLAGRAAESKREAHATGIAPELLCTLTKEGLCLGIERTQQLSGSCSLIKGLVESLGIALSFDENLAERYAKGPTSPQTNPQAGLQTTELGTEVFLVSDEHGVVEASDMGGARAKKFVGAYKKLLDDAALRATRRRRPNAAP